MNSAPVFRSQRLTARASVLHNAGSMADFTQQGDLRLLLSYSQARPRIRSGDLLLWRPTSLMGRIICSLTRQPYAHVGLAGWIGEPHDGPNSVLMAYEFLQWYGGVAVTLSSQVQRWPGKCDVFRFIGPEMHHNRRAMLRMARRTGNSYGWRNFWRVGFRRWFRFWTGLDALVGMDTTDGRVDESTPLVCSEAVAAAWELPDWLVTPGDLAEMAEYQFTLL